MYASKLGKTCHQTPHQQQMYQFTCRCISWTQEILIPVLKVMPMISEDMMNPLLGSLEIVMAGLDVANSTPNPAAAALGEKQTENLSEFTFYGFVQKDRSCLFHPGWLRTYRRLLTPGLNR